MTIDAPNHQYPDNIPHVAGDIGTEALALNDATNTYSPLHEDASGNLKIVGSVEVTSVPQTHVVVDNPLSGQAHKYKRVTAAGNTVIKSSPGTITRILSGGVGATCTVTVYDNTDASGAVVGTIYTTNEQPTVLELGVAATIGIAVKLSIASDITVVYD